MVDSSFTPEGAITFTKPVIGVEPLRPSTEPVIGAEQIQNGVAHEVFSAKTHPNHDDLFAVEGDVPRPFRSDNHGLPSSRRRGHLRTHSLPPSFKIANS